MTPDLCQRILRIAASYEHWLGTPLVPGTRTDAELVDAVCRAPFPILAHGSEPDPLLNFGNAVALRLWEISWDELVRMPSRLTAEPDLQEERSRILQEVTRKGYATNYRGIRISRSGLRFMIENATVWNVLDEQRQKTGQAAMFRAWSVLPPA